MIEIVRINAACSTTSETILAFYALLMASARQHATELRKSRETK